MPQISSDQISLALFQTDPMHTCCQENDCFDEYDTIALTVAERLEKGQLLSEALNKTLSESFYDGEPIGSAKLEPTLALLSAEFKLL